MLPITALELDHEVPMERVSTGIAQLDEMFDGKGYYKEFAPEGVILDPISNLTSIGASLEDIKLMFLRILDYLKKNKIITLCTNLTTGGLAPEATEVGVSSIMDTWILLENIKKEDQRQRFISIIKSRGMPHSKSVRGFELSDNGIVIDQ